MSQHNCSRVSGFSGVTNGRIQMVSFTKDKSSYSLNPALQQFELFFVIKATQ